MFCKSDHLIFKYAANNNLMFRFIQTPRSRDVPVIRPNHFDSTKMLKRLGIKVGVIVFTERSFANIKRLLKGKSFSFGLRAALSGNIATFLTRYGSAPSCLDLEQMIEAGIKRIIVFGEAGSISPRVKAGDVVGPSGGSERKVSAIIT